MELSGTIYRLSEAQDISEKFRKREVVIKTDDQYPQTIPVEFVQDRIDLLNSYSEGQQVTISINIRGREWTSPKGEVKFFVSVQLAYIRLATSSNITSVAPPPIA